MAVEVSLDLMIDFLERIVIPSFGQPPPFAEGIERSEWMKMKSQNYAQGPILMEVLANVLETEEEANERLDSLQTRQRSQEIQLLLQLQTSKPFRYLFTSL
jgi:hypothetical protein